MTAFDKMREKQEHSGWHINRPRSYQCETRKKKKMSAKSQWYKAGGFSTIMFVPATPHRKLANMLRESERKMAQERGWRIKKRKRWPEDQLKTCKRPVDRTVWHRWMSSLPKCRNKIRQKEQWTVHTTASNVAIAEKNAQTPFHLMPQMTELL